MYQLRARTMVRGLKLGTKAMEEAQCSFRVQNPTKDTAFLWMLAIYWEGTREKIEFKTTETGALKWGWGVP